MEPPLKRPRYDHSDDEENQDELSFHPVQFDKIQDPGYQLDKGRARAANRLKNTFEDIFAKYGKDFGDDEGDVVNFYTGKIEVDNGHVQSLETHKLGDEESESVGDEEEERISTGQPSKPSKALAPRNSFKQNGVSHRRPSWESHSGLNTYRLSSFAVVPPKVGADPPFNFGSSLFGNNKAVDPVWDLPDLPVQQFYYQNNSLSDLFTNHGPKRLTTAKSFGVRRPSVSSEANDDGSGEDDILVGTNQQRETTSPVPPAKAVKETGNKDTPISDATPPRQGQQRRLLPPAESKDVLAMKTNLGPQSNGPRATHAIGVGDSSHAVLNPSGPTINTRCERCRSQHRSCDYQEDLQTCIWCSKAGVRCIIPQQRIHGLKTTHLKKATPHVGTQPQEATVRRRLSLPEVPSQGISAPGPQGKKIEIVFPRMLKQLRKTYSCISLDNSPEPEDTRVLQPSPAMAHPNSVIVPVFQETTYESREERRGRNPSRMTKEIQSDDANMETQSQSSEAANTIEEPSVPPQSSPTPIAEPTIDTARSPRPITPSGTQESEAIGSSRARMSTELYDDITQSKLHQHRSINDLESGTSESTLQSGNEPVRSENHRCSSPVSNGDEEELSADNAIGEPAEVNTGVNGDKPSINMALEYAESIHIDQDVHEGLLDCLEGPPYNSQDKSAPTTPTSSRVQMIRAQSPPTTDADPAESIEYSLAKDIPEPFALTLDIYKGLETSVMLRESTVASVPESPNVGKSNFTDTSYTAVEFSVFEPLATPKSNSNQHETTRPPSPLSKAGALEVEVTIEEDPNNMVLDEPVTAQRDIEDETEDFFTSDGSGDEGYAHSPYLAAIDSPELGVLDSLEPSELVLRLGDAQARESTEPEPLQRSSSPELGTAISPPRLPPSSPSPAPKCIPNSTPVSRKGSPSKPKSKSRTSMPMIPKKSSKPPIAKKKSTPSSSHRRTPSPKKKQLLLTSLLPDNGADEDDSDDDELSIIGSAQKASASLPAPRSFSPASLKRKHSLLAETTPHSSSNRLSLPGKTVAPATDSRARKGSIGRGREWGRTKLAPHSSPLVRAVANRMLATPRPRQNGPRPGSGSVGRFSSPGGGSARKCGVAGYTCDRDFCLTCCI